MVEEPDEDNPLGFRPLTKPPLDTLGHVRTELGKIYREARHGRMDPVFATRLCGILKEIRCCLEAMQEVETSLAIIRRKFDYEIVDVTLTQEQLESPKGNGHDSAS